MGISEGVAGNAAKLVGNCMPGESDTCRHELLEADLWLVPEAQASTLTSNMECEPMLPSTQPEQIDATVVALETGRYGASLKPGRYMPVVVRSPGCGTCILLGVEDSTVCSLITVEPSKVTRFDVELDLASH